MKRKYIYLYILTGILLCASCTSNSDNADHQLTGTISYGGEKIVAINDLSFDAMEPFISPNGEFLFFNNLNDGVNTKIFYARRANDSIFNFAGELNGTNQEGPPHLDAVPDIDINNNFYWTSTRNYPFELNNLFYGTFKDGSVSNIGRVQGNFYKGIPGWIVMDHGISLDGQSLYFNNARFDDSSCQGPCETELGIANKTEDSTFAVIPDSALYLNEINDSNYIYYAPHISSDNLELYFTRYTKGSIGPDTLVEICVATRQDSSSPFSSPLVLFSGTVANIVEAPSLTKDKTIMYYHKKIDGTHKVMMRYRDQD